MKNFTLSIFVVFLSYYSFSQCSGGSLFATTNAPTTNITATVTTCNYSGEYNIINNIVAGSSYTITAIQNSNGNQRCITVHTGSSTGPVVTSGMGTVTFVAPSSGTYYVNVNQNCSGCLTASSCITMDITCNSCPATSPCTTPTNILGCGAAYSISTTGASSFVSSLCATATPGLESVYTYTATTTGNYSINVTAVTGGGYAIGYNTACGATGWTCVGTATVPGSIGSIPMVSGTTYYFILDATSTAASSMTFQLTCPPSSATTAGDCNVAVNVCSDASFAIDPNGFGLINEICIAGTCASNPSTNPASANSGCLLSEELNSTWMIVNVYTGGNLTFSMGTPNSTNWYCLDWAMWPYSPTACSSISSGTLAPVRCNYNGSCEEFTGLASTLPSGATSMTNWEPPLAVASSTQYLICLSNFSSAYTNIPLSFGGTAVVSCSPLAAEAITLSSQDFAGYNKLTWNTTAEFNVKHYLVQRSTDGVNFSTIETVSAEGLSMTAVSYSYEDLSPRFGNNYYRVILVHENNSLITSDIVISQQKSDRELEIVRSYPNPASNELNIVIASKVEDDYEIYLQNTSGKIVLTQKVHVTPGYNLSVLDVEQLNQGLYILSATSNGKQIQCGKVAVN